MWRRLAEKDGHVKRLEEYFDIVECPECKGERLSEAGRNVIVNGTRLPQLSQYSLEELCDWISDLSHSLAKQHYELAEAYLRDINTKLLRFINVGLGYLSLDRQTVTLSGGELQRLRLAAVLDSELTGVIYTLDEPTAGLHPRDVEHFLVLLDRMVDAGSTVVVVEHNQQLIKHCDWVIDLGPEGGAKGGRIMFSGTPEEMARTGLGITSKYL